MAQLNDLLVMGQSTLLGPATIHGAVNMGSTLTVAGATTIKGATKIYASNFNIYSDQGTTSKFSITASSGNTTLKGILTQGSPSSDSSITSMNRFATDIFVAGNGSAPNTPEVAGFYLGKSTSDENRHMDIVSGGDVSYIDFNKASHKVDYDARLYVDVKTGATYWYWGSHADLTNKSFNITGPLYAHLFGSADASMTLVPEQNNELNFGGTSNSSTIFFGYRTAGSKPVPTDFVFGGSSGTATLKAGKIQLTNTQDAEITNDVNSTSSDLRPGIIVGSLTGQHIEIDTNEVMSKATNTTASTLYLNADSSTATGGTVDVGSGGIETNGTYRYRTESSSKRILYGTTRNAGLKYDYAGNEALIISSGTYGNSSIHFYASNKLNMSDTSGQWTTTPSFAIKGACVAINAYFTGSSTTEAYQADPAYNLYVNGTSYFADNITIPGGKHIKTSRTGGRWIDARDNALIIYDTSIRSSSYSPLYSLKTVSGEVSSGLIYYGDQNNAPVEPDLVWIHNTDANYPNNNVTQTEMLRVSIEGAVTAKSYNATSDRRLKNNIQPLLLKNSILDLPLYKFDFINGIKNQIGCMAQDLQEICPEIVSENSEGYLSINESKIVYLLIDEVKKLKNEIQQLKGM